MRRAALFLPLLGLAPLGHFLSAYLAGAGIFSRANDFLVGAACVLLLPWLVAALFLTIGRLRWPVRIILFIGALLLQAALFMVIPAGATSETMGLAHRLRREFSPDQMRECAARLRQKHRDGTLVRRQAEKSRLFWLFQDAMAVDDSELPASLRGRFAGVFIRGDSALGEQEVSFALGDRTGIVCDSRKDVREYFVCSIADGVHAYRNERL